MELTALQIFKYLPAGQKNEFSNCKKCGCPTCMAFALKLAKQNIELTKCPYMPESLANEYLKSIKPPQKTIQIGDLKIGGENVLYRHEKTFINPTVLAVVVDCSEPDFQTKIDEINKFQLKSVNKYLKVDLIILKNAQENTPNSEIQTIRFEDFEKLELIKIVDFNFETTKQTLINTRRKAILEKDDNYSSPACVYLTEKDNCKLCAKSAYYICKYANMLIFDSFNSDLFSTLLTLRENIFTDPQKPLQVEAGLYEFNSPDKDSIIFLTTNFALTFFAVANELESLSIPSYLIVIPADGMSVLTAWSAEKFTANIVSKTIETLDIRNRIATRKIIIPGLLSHTTEELKQAVPDFEFLVGTNDASDIKEFVQRL